MRNKYPSSKYFEDGMIISSNSSESSLYNPIYISILNKNEYTSDSAHIFTYLSSIGFEEMIMVLYDEQKLEMKPVMVFDSSSISLPVPEMTIYYFSAIDKNLIRLWTILPVF